MARVFDVIEYPDEMNNELVHRIPESGPGNFRIGSQLIVRQGQAAVFFREGRALDTFYAGRHTLTTANVPYLIDYLGKLFNAQTPFPAEVYFVAVHDFVDAKWGTKDPIVVRSPGVGLGISLIQARGNYSFAITNPQQFVAQVVGAKGAYTFNDIQDRFRAILLPRLADLLGELGTKSGKSVLDLVALTEEIQAGVRAKAQDDFKALGVTLKGFLVESISPSEKSIEELRSRGLLDVATYTQLQAADALREAASNPSGGAGLTAGIGAGLGIGQIMGQALQGGMGAMGGSPAPAGGGGAAPAPDVMSPAEAAQYLKVTEADVMQMITEGTIKAKKIGSQFRISKSVLDEFLKS